ncbi:MAG: hypothetical protein U9P10_01240 [Thermodesulfobacteriota bacterium]|nr:hypothetical protein [Thermodesulfobacteriota bacterium]
MYYIYFPYAFVLALFVFFDLSKHRVSKWWALAVFVSPLVSIYYFIKTRALKGAVPVLFVIVSFAAVGVVEKMIYSMEKEKAVLESFSPEIRQLLVLSKDLKTVTIRLDNGIEKLEQLSKIQSRRVGVGKTIDYIGELRVLILENKTAVTRLNLLISDYRDLLEKENLLWMENIKAFYNNDIVVRYEASLQSYLETFETLLQYIFDNFEKIDSKSSVHIKNYDAYYMKYRQAVDRHNRIGVKKIKFQNNFLVEHPRLKPYLPSTRQTDFLKLWE